MEPKIQLNSFSWHFSQAGSNNDYTHEVQNLKRQLELAIKERDELKVGSDIVNPLRAPLDLKCVETCLTINTLSILQELEFSNIVFMLTTIKIPGAFIFPHIFTTLYIYGNLFL